MFLEKWPVKDYGVESGSALPVARSTGKEFVLLDDEPLSVLLAPNIGGANHHMRLRAVGRSHGAVIDVVRIRHRAHDRDIEVGDGVVAGRRRS